RRLVGPAGDADRSAGGLRDHVEGEPLPPRAVGAEPLDAAVDNDGVELFYRLVVEPQPLDRAGRHIFGRDIRLPQHVLDDLEALWRLEVDRQRLLVDVELAKIPGIIVGLAGAQPAAGIAPPRVLDLDHLGTKPGEYL